MRAQIISVSGSRIVCQAQAVPASMSLPVGRIANIDRLRILAAIGIVWFHMEAAPHRQIAYAGLPIFLLIFYSLLTAQGPAAGTTADFLRRRCSRLLKPWLFWSVVYGLCRLAKAWHTMDIASLRAMLSPETLLAGTSIHLWYLPYAFVSSLLIRGFNRRTSQVGHATVILGATAAGVVLLAIHAMGLWNQNLVRPLPQWEFGLAAVPLGIAVGRCLAIGSRSRQRLFLAAISLAVVVECRILHSVGLGSPALPYGIGVTLVCLAYSREIGFDIVVASLAPLTFGVYLIHPLVGYALRHTLTPNGHYISFGLLTVCLSIVLVQVLMRTPIRRFL